MGLEEVIGGALADAREEGIIEPGESDEIVAPVEGEETETETTVVEGEEATPEVKDGEEAEEKEVVEGEEEKPTPEAKDKDKKKDDEEDPTAKEIGPAKDNRGRENRIPHSRVQAIVGNAVKREVLGVVSKAATALGLDIAKVTPENFDTVLKTVTTEVAGLRDRVEGMDNLEPIMAKDGEAFIRMLAAANPDQYQKFVDFLEGKGTETTAKVSADEPQPDVEITLPDGSKGKTYSMEGLQKRDAWVRKQILDEADARIAKRFKPLDDARTAAQKRSDDQAQLVTDLRELLDEAATWDGFTENADAIKAEMDKIDKKVKMGPAMRQAYQTVVVKKYKADKTTMRAEILKELKKAPKSTSTVTSGAQPKKKDATARGEGGEVVGGTEAIIRNALADAKASGRL